MGDRFSVELDRLDEVVAILTATEESLAVLGVDLDHRVAALQQEWHGLAAQAQAAAHEHWTAGLTSMREALAVLRLVGHRAETSYREAADANLALWKQVAP